MVGNGACANLRALAVPLGGCANACANFFLTRCARGGWLQAVGNRAGANLRSFAVPLGGCANACVNFFLARCARGGCKWSETELALIYVCSLCRWAVAQVTK